MEKLERTLSDVQNDLSNPPEASDQPKKVKKVAKDSKKAKKVAKKTDKAESKKASKDNGDRVLLADLASEAEITTASARRKLRDAEMSPEGRWAWETGSKALKDARKVLGLDA